MSLSVYNRPVTKEELERNFNTLHDKVHNYVTVRQMYNPPTTVGFTNINANEVVYKAGMNQAKMQGMARERKLKLIRMALEKQRKERKLNRTPTVNARPSVSVVKAPALSHS
tara:strand:- start:1159 stop:1494 length:336 start_codon:yes stop_codon:yes gene_type:complete